MQRTHSAVITLLLAGIAFSADAQAPGARPPGTPMPQAPGEVRGTIVEADGNTPVPGASIAVRAKLDSSLVTGAVARENGSFLAQGLRPGEYYLRVTAIGFTPRSVDFSITEAAPRADAGRITLGRFAVTLQDVEVTVERPEVVIEPDRNSYSARQVAPAATNASEVLQATPSIEVDADGRVSLRGNENVAVQINGRPAPIRGAQLGAYLRQLPASVLDRVEVIPTPSARHDPEGMAGIINIVLKQNADLGWSGGFTGSASPSNRYNLSGNLGYQAGPLTSFTSYGFNADERPVVGINDRERFDALRQPLSFVEQDIQGEQGNNGHNFNTTLDYKLNARDNLYTALAMNRRRSNEDLLSAYTELSGDRSLLAEYDRWRNTEAKGLMFDYTAAFKRTFEARRHELNTEVRFNRQDDWDRQLLWRETTSGGTTRSEMEDNVTDALTSRLTAQLDYTRPLGERGKLETGYKGEGRWLERDFTALRDPAADGNWVPGNLTNSFELDENVHAVYGVVSRGVGRWELQAGLRAEHATRDFALATTAENFPYSYSSLFPSAVASYKLSDATTAKFSYSRRIRRPGTQELNPFPQFMDAQNVFIGNPRLNPEYTDAIELSIHRTGQRGMIQLSPFYRRTTDIMRFIVDTDAVVDGRDVTSITFENLATGNSWGADVNGQLRLGPKFSAIAGFNIYKMVTEGGSESALFSDAVMWSGRLNMTSQVTSSTTLQAFYFYRAPQVFENGRFSPFQNLNLSVRQKLNDRTTLSLRVLDPFNKMGFRAEVGRDDIWQATERRFGARSVHLNLQYTFGQTPRIRQPQPEQPQGGGGFPTGG
jgi:ferric enterobactin receptor